MAGPTHARTDAKPFAHQTTQAFGLGPFPSLARLKRRERRAGEAKRGLVRGQGNAKRTYVGSCAQVGLAVTPPPTSSDGELLRAGPMAANPATGLVM